MNSISYPENLIFKIIGSEMTATEDIFNGLNYVMRKHLTPHQRMVLEKYYSGCMTVREISEFLGVSVSRIYQIRDRAIKKLRRPNLRNFIANGYKASISEMETKKIERIQQLSDSPSVPVDDVSHLLGLKASISLRRAGIHDLNEIKCFDQLLRLRGVGKKTVCEIKEIMEANGIFI